MIVNCSIAHRAMLGEGVCGPDRPVRACCPILAFQNNWGCPATPSPIAAMLKQVAESWGTQFADALILDPRWPGCDQSAAIRATALIVDHAITRIVAILDESDEFREHTPGMALSLRAAFWESMPNGAAKNRSSSEP
jgi:hypothetical protein